mgnify:FL=1
MLSCWHVSSLLMASDMQVSLSTARAAGHPHLSDFAVRTGGGFGLAVLLGILLCVKVDQPC